jgi:hypothetical protein
MVPLSVTFGQESFNDRLGMSTPHFYTKLKESSDHPQTSQPAVGAYVRTFKRLLEEYDEIITVTLSRLASGTYQSASSAANMVDPDRIHLINSRTLTGASGTLVRMLASELSKPYDDLKEVISKIEAARDNVRLFACARNLKAAAAGGRINKHAGKLLDFLRIRPVLGVNTEGKISKLGIAFGYKRGLQATVTKALKFAKGRTVQDVIITHASAHEEAEMVSQKLQEKLELKSIPVIETGAVLGTHVGLGTVAVNIRVTD